jgi:uroporphyrinogen III methyltransferase/synthase
MSTRGGQGRVYLVGAGPGDPRLITIRGAQCLGEADVVFYDALANPRLLAMAPAHAKKTLVGKRHGRVTVAQDEIERLIVTEAKAGKIVVRLKGGDPFVFGRGGEEAEACVSAGVPFEIVPGVTSAVAVPAYAGIPLTHREHSSSVTFITGRPGKARSLDVDWPALAKTDGTLVFLMAVLAAGDITRNLREAGMDPQTPVAAIRWGTLPRQTTLVSTLGDFVARIDEEKLRPPAVIVVGAVAALANSIAWYESLPLFGKRVVVTRARHQAGALADRLEALGADVVEYPVIELAAAADDEQLRAAFDSIGGYDWLVLTSVNGVERFLDAFLGQGRDLRDLAGVSLAAIGPATRRSLEIRGLRVAACPDEYRAEALAEAIGDVAGCKVLLARAEQAREVLPETLRQKGAEVDVLPVYRTVLPDPAPDPHCLEGADIVTFTSAGTVSHFLTLSGELGRNALEGAVVAAIGPITAERLAEAGREADLVAQEYTIPGLVEALVKHVSAPER